MWIKIRVILEEEEKKLQKSTILILYYHSKMTVKRKTERVLSSLNIEPFMKLCYLFYKR